MPERFFLARWFLAGGGALAIVSLVLWRMLPISMEFPPYLGTALLVLAYGATGLKWRRPGSGRKP